jgi:hypothetical protein
MSSASTKASPVTADTIIAIVFGLFGIMINLLAVVLAYLTLRAMIIDGCKSLFFSLPEDQILFSCPLCSVVADSLI